MGSTEGNGRTQRGPFSSHITLVSPIFLYQFCILAPRSPRYCGATIAATVICDYLCASVITVWLSPSYSDMYLIVTTRKSTFSLFFRTFATVGKTNSVFQWCHAGGVVDYVFGGWSHPSDCVHGTDTSHSLFLLSRGVVLEPHPGIVRVESGIGVTGFRIPTAPLGGTKRARAEVILS